MSAIEQTFSVIIARKIYEAFQSEQLNPETEFEEYLAVLDDISESQQKTIMKTLFPNKKENETPKRGSSKKAPNPFCTKQTKDGESCNGHGSEVIDGAWICAVHKRMMDNPSPKKGALKPPKCEQSTKEGTRCMHNGAEQIDDEWFCSQHKKMRDSAEKKETEKPPKSKPAVRVKAKDDSDNESDGNNLELNGVAVETLKKSVAKR